MSYTPWVPKSIASPDWAQLELEGLPPGTTENWVEDVEVSPPEVIHIRVRFPAAAGEPVVISGFEPIDNVNQADLYAKIMAFNPPDWFQLQADEDKAIDLNEQLDNLHTTAETNRLQHTKFTSYRVINAGDPATLYHSRLVDECYKALEDPRGNKSEHLPNTDYPCLYSESTDKQGNATGGRSMLQIAREVKAEHEHYQNYEAQIARTVASAERLLKGATSATEYYAAQTIVWPELTPFEKPAKPDPSADNIHLEFKGRRAEALDWDALLAGMNALLSSLDTSSLTAADRTKWNAAKGQLDKLAVLMTKRDELLALATVPDDYHADAKWS